MNMNYRAMLYRLDAEFTLLHLLLTLPLIFFLRLFLHRYYHHPFILSLGAYGRCPHHVAIEQALTHLSC
jgi:hypothetical protein